MSKLFKVGDKVQRTKKIDGKIMRGVIVTKRPGPAIDIKLTEGAGNYAAGDIYGGSIYFWEVIEETDELPPVPDSVYYPDMFELLTGVRAAGGTSGLTLRKSPYTHSAVSLSIDDSKWTRLDADAALQLAHDLRRMAMGIKRKGKADVI
ncbi:unknown function [Klebsiella phage vB_Kpn_K15PH90]|uniref:Uncharacterized protein n=1 Tax=Klebsiella phage vB_Kpn_K15PH90 TaxID=3071635 RepID=A0AAV1MJ96_9CAUD|nr:unknown function [Klebsiella phage vB_Kpn_K15PH90]